MLLSINGKQYELGLFEAQQAMEACESKAGLRSTEPTVELLNIVATWATARFRVNFTLTAAWQLWWACCEIIENSRKANQRIADVGAWLHIDATNLAEDQLFGLSANLPRVKAQHKLQAGQFDPLAYDSVFELVLLATGSEDQARAAKAQALERYVDSRCGVAKHGS